MRMVTLLVMAAMVLWRTTGEVGESEAAEHSFGRRIAVSWNDKLTGSSVVGAINSRAPWDYVTDPLEVGHDPLLRFAFGRLYVVSSTDDTIQVVAPDSWTIERSYQLDPGSIPLDIVVVSPETAYVTRRESTHLLRLDLLSGDTEEIVDLSAFADPDGIPDLGMMAEHEGRLFVQIRRFNLSDVNGFVPPSYLGVVDIASGQIIDVDPVLPGVQAIQLEGTAPKLKMQVLQQSRRLFVGATGRAFDAGGIEMIDLDALQSRGMVVREADGLTGADLGPFTMVDSQRGYLVYTTDLTISSHLQEFSLSSGVDPDPLHVAVEYFAPALESDPLTDALFFPHSGGEDDGIHVFSATTGERLTMAPIPTSGPPTDLVLMYGPPGDFNFDGTVNAADYVAWRKSDGTQEGYETWRSHFGQTAGSGSPVNGSVPEPATFTLLALAVAGWYLRRGQSDLTTLFRLGNHIDYLLRSLPPTAFRRHSNSLRMHRPTLLRISANLQRCLNSNNTSAASPIR